MRMAKLGDVVESMKNGIYKPASEYTDDGMPCLRMYNIDAGAIVWRDIKRMRLSKQEQEDYGLREGDLLVNRVNSRELVGKSAYVPASMEASVFESKNIRLRLRGDQADSKFINFQLLARGSRHFANNAQQVVGMASISQGQLAEFPIVLAHIQEQREIVAEIEKQFSRLDEAIANLQRAKVNLRRLRNATRDAALRDDLFSTGRTAGASGRGPLGWRMTTIREIAAETLVGLDRGRDMQMATLLGTPYVKMNNINLDGEVESERLVYVNTNASESERYKLVAGDILFNTRNSSELVGKTGLVPAALEGAVYNNNLMRLRLTEGALPAFLCMQMCGSDFRKRLERVKKATTSVAAVYLKDLLPLPIVLPPLADQHRIVAEVDRRLSIVRGVEAQVDANLKRAQALRQAVLAKAFSATSATSAREAAT